MRSIIGGDLNLVKGRDPKNTWEIVGIYRSPNKDMRVFEKLAHWTRYSGRTMTCSIIGGDLNIPYADWNGHVEKSRGNQVFLNRLVLEKGNTQVLNSMTWGMLCFMCTLSGPKVLSPLAVMFRGSVINVEYYMK